MLQLDGLRGAPNPEYVPGNTSTLQQPATQPGELLSFPPRPQPTTGATGHGLGSMIHWGTAFHQQHQQQPQQKQSSRGVNNSEEDDDDEYRPFTPPPPRERLSYTRYQLELLNGIYQEVRYPNSTQKQLIAKRVGITREQVKIWFQNRRRKDVVTSKQPAGKDTKDEATSGESANVSSPAQPSSNENSNQMDETKGSIGDNNSNSNNKTCNNILAGNDGDTNQGSDSGLPAITGVSNGCSPDFENTGSQASNDSLGSCSVGNETSRLSSSVQNTDQSNSTTAASTSQMTMVSPVVLRSMITELNKFDNEYLKLKKGKKKKNKSKSSKHLTSLSSSSSSLGSSSLTQCKAQRLFQSYDMVAPPNKVTPSAFLNTSANRFKHAGGTSAFQNPRDSRIPALGSMTANDSRFWEGFAIGSAPTLPGSADPPELLQQRSPTDLLQSPTHQSPFGSFLSSSAVSGSHTLSNPQSPLYDNIPVLTDLLGSYKNHPSSPGASAVAAAAVAQRQLEHSLLSQAGQPPSVHSSGLFPFHGSSTGGSSSNSTSSDKSPSCDLPFPSPPSHHPFTLHPHHPSPFPLNRVFPFPLIADPPMMLSSIRQAETYRHTQWPHPPSPLSSQPPPPPPPHGSSLASHNNSSITPNMGDDPYRPLVISSLGNPYFSPSASGYTFPSSTLPPPPPLWSVQQGGSNNTPNFTDL